MVKVVLLFLLLSAIGSGRVSGQILVGPVGGVNYSWTSFADKDLRDAYRVSPVIGFHAGGHLSFRVQKRFFLHTSLVYSSKGRLLEGKLDGLLRNDVRYNFIEMPISYTVDFKGRISRNKEFKYFLGIGPNLSYWLNAKGTLFNSDFEEENLGELTYHATYKTLTENQAPDEMSIEEPNRVQFGLNIIAGMVLEPAPRQRVMLSVRYEIGHTYLAKTNGMFLNTYYQDPLRSRNQGFRVSLAYLFDLKTEERKKGKSTLDKQKNRRRR
jgi:hypothetical protein